MSDKNSSSMLAGLMQWRRYHPIWWHFILGVAFGLAFDAVLHVARPVLPVLTELETTAADWMIRFWVQRDPDPGPSGIEKPYYPFVWVNIDEQTYEFWKEPLTIPRGELWKLLARVIEGDPALVILDVALDRSTKQPGDDRLRRCLEEYSSRDVPSHGQKENPASEECFKPGTITHERRRSHIILPAIFNQSPDISNSGSILKKERPSDFLDGVVANSQFLHWTSTKIDWDDDYVVRRWQLFEPALSGGKSEVRVFPAMPLLAWAILREPDVGRGKFDLIRFQRCLDRTVTTNIAEKAMWSSEECQSPISLAPNADLSHKSSSQSCSASKGGGFALWDRVLGKPLCMSLNPPDVEQRILYPLGDVRYACPGYKKTRGRTWSPPYIDFHNEPVPLTWCVSALEVLRDEVPPLRFKDRVVVIGASYEDSRDFHVTPLGRMPGAVWMMNATQALMQYGQMEELDGWKRFLLILVSIVVFALAFARFTSLGGALVSAFVVVVCLVPLSLALFKLGTWLDVALPLLGVAAHHIFSDLIDERFSFFRDQHEP